MIESPFLGNWMVPSINLTDHITRQVEDVRYDILGHEG